MSNRNRKSKRIYKRINKSKRNNLRGGSDSTDSVDDRYKSVLSLLPEAVRPVPGEETKLSGTNGLWALVGVGGIIGVGALIGYGISRKI